MRRLVFYESNQIISVVVFVYKLIEVDGGKVLLGWEFPFRCGVGEHGYYVHGLKESLHKQPKM
jgi:hypothetical protein